MRRFLRRIGVVMLAVVMVCSTSYTVGAATPKSDGKNMQKVLKYYKANQIGKVKKYNKKLSKTAKENCVKKMSSKIKKAYLNEVKKYPETYSYSKEYLWGYFLTDIDNDKKADLIIETGTCEADARYQIYQYKKGKAVKVGEIGGGHSTLHAYPNHKGIIVSWGHMGYESISVVTLKKGKVMSSEIGSRKISYDKNSSGDWLILRCALDSHVSYDSHYKKSVDYSDLK